MDLIARAPVRISFGGGGTDLPAYYEKHGGLVVSAAINYYAYTILTPCDLDRVQIISADYRTLSQRPTCEDLIWDGDLSLPKAITYHFNIQNGLTIFLATQVPPGTGLGSSGSVAVSMIKALAFWSGLDLGPREVAELACHIEIEKMGMPVGKQDQYAAAFGDLNCFTFSTEGVVKKEPLKVTPETLEGLEKGLMLFYTGKSRQSSSILRRQKKASQAGDRATVQRLGTIKALGLEIKTALEKGDLEAFGELLHRSWMQKRQLTEGITTPLLDASYRAARENGALGGKLTGAGGGGFLLLYCSEEKQEGVASALAGLGLRHRPFRFDHEGVKVMQAVPWSQLHAPNRVPVLPDDDNPGQMQPDAVGSGISLGSN